MLTKRGKPMHSHDVLEVQRSLRRRLLDDRTTLPWRPARDLAALLLLHVDEPEQCWELTAEWLRELLDADRVDGGFVSPENLMYSPQAESVRASRYVPSVVGIVMNAQDPSIGHVWANDGIVVFDDVAQRGPLGVQLRTQLLSVGTRSKLSFALWDASNPVGLLCADWLDLKRSWTDNGGENLTLLAREVLGPILAASRQLSAGDVKLGDDRATSGRDALSSLTPAEMKIACMVANGLSYKEIARELNRSFSTVDHQLRSVRDKLGVSSTARLIRVLSELIPPASRTLKSPASVLFVARE
jgi:DNA-binding CsgD family transcriptional regulator